jgi:hypothetical protein
MPSSTPTRDGELRDFANTFAGKIAAQAVALGFTVVEATALTTAASDYSGALDEVLDPETKTKGKVAFKNLKRAVLRTTLNSFIARLRVNPNLTDAQLTDLNVARRDSEPTPRPAPTSQPVLTVLGIVNDFDVVVRSVDLVSGKKARPVGVQGIAFYTAVGENPSTDIEDWRHDGLTGKSQFTCGMRPEDAGKLITIRARYFNAKGEFGPLSAPVTAIIPKAIAQ